MDLWDDEKCIQEENSAAQQQLSRTSRNIFQGTFWDMYSWRYVNVQYEIPLQSAEEKLTCYISRYLFIAYMQIYHAQILSIMHVTYRTVLQNVIYCFLLSLDSNSHLECLLIVSKIKRNIPSEICSLLILLLPASAYLDKGLKGVWGAEYLCKNKKHPKPHMCLKS